MTDPDAFKYTKGAFVTYRPDAKAGEPANTIPFAFNPESLTRTVALQAAQSQPGTEGAQAKPGAATQPSQQATNPDAGATIKESFSVTIRIDAADRDPSVQVTDKFGIAPEIAAIEQLLYPMETAPQQPSTGAQAVAPVGARPFVLFVWGPKRIVPVRIVSLKIDETMYDSALNPVRAEIEMSLEVLGLAEAKADTAVASALAFTDKNRRELAGNFYAQTSARGHGLVEPLQPLKKGQN